ncbi:SAM-dependent methyltransferase [Nocardia albiluteola]|uniref:SAM-dependent methyltransferase n=1 Tax=Nocardia albiluteola TaxID=2842303 RepID=UPI0027DEEC8E|nr:SAM-dependent methyltransferase [Nocardia albiluteola]
MPDIERVPEGIDPSTPSAARVYDYFLGGRDNYAADRALAEWLLSIAPDSRTVARLSRQFVLKAVELIAEAGIRQFIDIGAGIPTSPSVHEVAQKVDSAATVVSIDYDPVVHAYGNAFLSGTPGVTTMQADVRRPDDIIDRLRSGALIDFEQPVAILLCSILHFVLDDEHPAEIIARFRTAIPSGSYVAFTHPSDEVSPAGMAQLASHNIGSPTQFVSRSRTELAGFFDGFEFLGGGVVPVQDWLDGEQPTTQMVWLGGICRKP